MNKKLPNDEINLISIEQNGIYLAYLNGKYSIYAKDKPTSTIGGKNPQELYDDLLLNNVYDELDNTNKLLIGIISDKTEENQSKAKEIFIKLMEDLYNLYFNVDENNARRIVSERINGIDNNKIKENFNQKLKEYEKSKYAHIEKLIKELLTARKRGDVEIARRELSKFLTIKYGAILRKYVGEVYLIDGDGFILFKLDDLMLLLKKDFGNNFIHENDLKSAIGFISDRREPTPNIVKFKNCLYDMDKLKVVETSKPVFTLLQIDYDLNKNAVGIMFKNFLYSSFARDTPEETENAVKGIFQICGYLFTSGNKHNLLPIFTGLTGAGKSTFFNIITHIFGKNKISGVSLQNLENDDHAGSEFIESHLNIIRDSDTSMIENNNLLKNWTGNESFRINPKYKQPLDLPPEEVPKPILVCNTMPVFKVYEKALISRFLIVEFEKTFRNTDEQIPDLDKLIIADKSEIEWFIYQSIKAYKEMVENDEKFIFKITDDKTMELVEKHTHPLNHIIKELVLKHDPEAYDTDKSLNRATYRPIVTNDLVNVILLYSEKNAIDVPTDKHGKINKKKLLGVIKEEFDLDVGELIYNDQTGEYSNHRDYKARGERWIDRTGTSHNDRVYPNLIMKNLYWELLHEVENKKSNKQTK